MKKIKLDDKTVTIKKVGDHFVARVEGEKNSVFGSDEKEAIGRIKDTLRLRR